jgi:hypothetical protein
MATNLDESRGRQAPQSAKRITVTKEEAKAALKRLRAIGEKLPLVDAAEIASYCREAKTEDGY